MKDTHDKFARQSNLCLDNQRCPLYGGDSGVRLSKGIHTAAISQGLMFKIPTLYLKLFHIREETNSSLDRISLFSPNCVRSLHC